MFLGKALRFKGKLADSACFNNLRFEPKNSRNLFIKRTREHKQRRLVALPKRHLSTSLNSRNDDNGRDIVNYEDFWGLDNIAQPEHQRLDSKLLDRTVVVGISGGVDSSVSALLLKKAGFKNIHGVFMRNWDPQDETGELDTCPIAEDFKIARRVCEQLDEAEFIEEYWTEVFEPYIEMLKSGGTPNPDIFCNREIKFKAFLDFVDQKFGSDALVATGHYARLGKKQFNYDSDSSCKENRSNYPILLKAIDSNKDQTYFLCGVGEKALSRVIFPLGSIQKPKVRLIAKENNLCTAEKKDSVGICFVGKRKFTSFIENYLEEKPGKVINIDYDDRNDDGTKGRVIGEHKGLFRYTIGQGAKISGLHEKMFVAGKDNLKNELLVCGGDNNPALFSTGLFVNPSNMYWVRGGPPEELEGNETGTMRLQCKVRYRQAVIWCTLSYENQEDVTNVKNKRLKVTFDKPEKAVTPLQMVVFYDGGVCLGGGLIGETVDSIQD